MPVEQYNPNLIERLAVAAAMSERNAPAFYSALPDAKVFVLARARGRLNTIDIQPGSTRGGHEEDRREFGLITDDAATAYFRIHPAGGSAFVPFWLTPLGVRAGRKMLGIAVEDEPLVIPARRLFTDAITKGVSVVCEPAMPLEFRFDPAQLTELLAGQVHRTGGPEPLFGPG